MLFELEIYLFIVVTCPNNFCVPFSLATIFYILCIVPPCLCQWYVNDLHSLFLLFILIQSLAMTQYFCFLWAKFLIKFSNLLSWVSCTYISYSFINCFLYFISLVLLIQHLLLSAIINWLIFEQEVLGHWI